MLFLLKRTAEKKCLRSETATRGQPFPLLLQFCSNIAFFVENEKPLADDKIVAGQPLSLYLIRHFEYRIEHIKPREAHMHRFAVVLLIILVAVGFSSAQTTKAKTLTLAVSGMKCDNCVTKVDKALRGVEGVKDVNVSLKNNSAKVVLASMSVKPEVLLNAVSDAGFTASAGKLTVAAKKDAKESCGMDKEGKMKKEGASKEEDCCKDGKKDEASAKKEADCCKDAKKVETKN